MKHTSEGDVFVFKKGQALSVPVQHCIMYPSNTSKTDRQYFCGGGTNPVFFNSYVSTYCPCECQLLLGYQENTKLETYSIKNYFSLDKVL